MLVDDVKLPIPVFTHDDASHTGWGRGTKYCLVVLLLLLAGLLLGCGDDSPPVAATIGELCEMEPGTVVQVEGFFELPSFLNCTGNECRVGFVDEGQFIFAEIYTSENPRANMMQMPPNNYSVDDLAVVLHDESVAGRQTRVSATGRIRIPSENSCYLDVSSIHPVE